MVQLNQHYLLVDLETPERAGKYVDTWHVWACGHTYMGRGHMCGWSIVYVARFLIAAPELGAWQGLLPVSQAWCFGLVRTKRKILTRLLVEGDGQQPGILR